MVVKNRSSKKSGSLIQSRARFTLATALSVVVVAGAIVGYNITFGKARPTHAAQLQFCAQIGSGYCLNDWNGGGLGNQVRMYPGGASHESFALVTANVCGGNHYVTNTCPFSHSGLNSQYHGHSIVEVLYTPSNGSLCVGSKQFDAKGYLEYCSGANRGYGVIMIQSGNAYINRYWSDYYNSAVNMCSGGSSGGPVYLNGILGGGSCLWAP